MARTVRDAKLETRNARLRLSIRHEPYWRSIDSGMHLGYRKGKQKGSWLARYRTETGGYHKTVLGLADDVQDANGLKIISFSQAQSRARKWFEEKAMCAAGLSPQSKGRYTVADVISDYLNWFKIHRKGISQLEYTINAHILPNIGHVQVNKLTSAQIRSLHENIASSPARLRSRVGKPTRFRPMPKTPDEIRRRKTSANKVLNILKAAFNRAYVEGKIASDESWRRVKSFRGVDAAKVSYLSEEEYANLINVCPTDFRIIVQAAVLTGCRYGEITAMKVADFNLDSGTLIIEDSKSGKARHVVLTEEGQEFFKGIIKGKISTELIFTRKNGLKWGRSHQFRRLREACAEAGIEPAISFHILRHTHASYLAMSGTPLTVIAAQLGHSDTRMAEKHYAHLSSSYIADTIRAGFPKLSGFGK